MRRAGVRNAPTSQAVLVGHDPERRPRRPRKLSQAVSICPARTVSNAGLKLSSDPTAQWKAAQAWQPRGDRRNMPGGTLAGAGNPLSAVDSSESCTGWLIDDAGAIILWTRFRQHLREQG